MPILAGQGIDRASPKFSRSTTSSSASCRSFSPGRYAWRAARPREGHPGNHGTATAIFKKAIERGNLVVAEVTALELGRLELTDALELTALTALKDRPRSRRLAARWLTRWLSETRGPTIDDAVMVAGCLAALGGERHDQALSILRDLVG